MSVRTPIRVAYIIDSLGLGGAEKSLLEILSRFSLVEPRVCYLFADSALHAAFEAVGIPVYCINEPGRYPTIAGYRRLSRWLSSQKPDIVHLTGLYAQIVGAVAGRQLAIPIISSFTNEVDTNERYDELPLSSRLKLRLLDTLTGYTLRLSTHAIANSQTVRLGHHRVFGVPLEKVTVVYRGRDPRPFLDLPDRSIDGLGGAALAESSAPTIVNVSRLIPRKGHSELIRAMHQVLAYYPAAQLLIAGEGHYRPQLERLIINERLDGYVHLLGTVHDIPGLLARADVFVFPSHYEGLPGALIEAMLAACPILAADTAVHREMLTHRESGLLAEVGNPDAIGQALITLLNDPAAACKMGQRARAIALERFDIKDVAQQYEQVYMRVLNQHRAQR